MIITRFLIEFYSGKYFVGKLYKKDYIINGIKLMKKYLIPSLENQSCRDFIWIMMLGDKANKTFIKSLIDINTSFKWDIVYLNSINNYIKNITKDYDILITTRYDNDDIIYYDAVNDARKVININKPMLLHGYNKGFYYYESSNKYYNFEHNFKNEGAMSIFLSLIIVLNKVNETINVYKLGDHRFIRKNFFKIYRRYGIKEINYEPAVFDDGGPKFIYVRQNYSRCHYFNVKNNQKEIKFNKYKFYGR